MVEEIRGIELNLIDLPARGRQHAPDRIAELAKDMAKNGQLQDIIVTPKGGRFELVAGRGRYLAGKQLGWEKIQCLIKENLSELNKVLLMISENDEREDTSPIDRGLSYIWAVETGGLTQDALADRIGKTKGYISQYITVASLPEPVLEKFKRLNFLGIGLLNHIVRLPTPEAQIAMAEKCGKEDLSVKQLENLVNKALSASSNTAGKSGVDISIQPDHKAQPIGFHIAKSAKGIHIVGEFPATVTIAELLKAIGESFQEWQNQPHSLKAKKMTSPPKVKGQPSKSSGQILNQDNSENVSSVDALQKMVKAFAGGKGCVPTDLEGFMSVQLEASLVAMNQRLADPNVSEEEKSNLKEGIKKLQEKLSELKQK